jgi:hypothetical protein
MLIESAKRYEDIEVDKRKQPPAQKRNVGLILGWICFFASIWTSGDFPFFLGLSLLFKMFRTTSTLML